MPKISKYTAAPSAADEDITILIQGGVTKKIALSVLKEYMGAGDILNKFDGDGPPQITDDETAGYSGGSVWIDATADPKEAYRCADATEGAAVWLKTTLSLDELGSAALADSEDFMASVAPEAEGDMIAAEGSPIGWVRKTLAQIKTLLGLGSAAYTDTTAYDVAGAAAGVGSALDTVKADKIAVSPDPSGYVATFDAAGNLAKSTKETSEIGGGTPPTPAITITGNFSPPTYWDIAVPTPMLTGDGLYEDSGGMCVLNGDFDDATYDLSAAETIALTNIGGILGELILDQANEAALVSIDMSDIRFTRGALTINDLPTDVDVDLSFFTISGGDFIFYGNSDMTTPPDLSAFTICDGVFDFGGNSVMTTPPDLSALTTCGGDFYFGENSVMTTPPDLSALTTCGGSFSFYANTSMTTLLDLTALLEITGYSSFDLNAFDQTSVDAILVRLAALDGTEGTTSYDSHEISVSGPLTSVPGATGLAAKTTLEGRGNTVYVNIDFAITAAAADPVNTFAVESDQTEIFTEDVEFVVYGSTGNDGTYTVLSSAYITDTVITVNESVPSSVGDGTIRWYPLT